MFRIKSTSDGVCAIDMSGHHVAGPFANEAEAREFVSSFGEPPRQPGRPTGPIAFDPRTGKAYVDHRYGKLGPASEVRRIDPASYLAEKAKSKN
jgi:hypothetical protein